MRNKVNTPIKTLAIFIGSLLSCVLTPGVAAQDQDFRDLGRGYAHLISFEAEPEIAAAWFTVDNNDESLSDSDISTTKLPLYKEFESDQHEWRWFAQGAVSYMTYEESLYIEEIFERRESLTPKYTAYGGLLEGGVIMPLSNGFSLAPSLGLGVSSLENETKFSNPLIEDMLPPNARGQFYDWDTLASVARGHLALLYDQEHGSFRLKGSAHLSYSYIDSFHESTDFQGFHNHSSTFTLKLDVRHPLNVSVREHPLFIIGHLGNTTFLGSGRDELGFSYFNELGISLGVESVAIGIMGLLGDDVDGWSLTFNYDY